MSSLPLLALVALLTSLPGSEACSCFPSHIQTYLCRAEIAVLVRVLQHNVIINPPWDTPDPYGDNRFPVAVRRVFKGPGGGPDLLRFNAIYSQKFGATCGMYFSPNTDYLVLGSIRDGKITTGLCTGTQQWSTIGEWMRRVIVAEVLTDNCVCQVATCYDGDCFPSASTSPRNATCRFDFSTDDCLFRYGACVLQPASCSSPSRCSWRTDYDHPTCSAPRTVSDPSDI